jgi:1-acyl-sn-glycerol-3-phosphate acyltransferase
VGITLFETRSFHLERVPRRGALMLASTHQSLLDPWIVGMCPDRHSSYLAKESLFRVPILSWLLRKYGCIPVPRERAVPKKAMEVSLKVLESGRSLVLFPEGTRAPDGRLQPLRRGISLLASRSKAHCVPVLVRGSRRCLPKGAWVPRPGTVDVCFGDPIEFNPSESSDSFIQRLSGCYRHLAIEAGAPELLEGESCPGGRSTEEEESSRPSSQPGASPALEGESSLSALPTAFSDGMACVKAGK